MEGRVRDTVNRLCLQRQDRLDEDHVAASAALTWYRWFLILRTSSPGKAKTT